MESKFEKRAKPDDALTISEAVTYILDLIEKYRPIQTTIVIDGLDEIDKVPEYTSLHTNISTLLQSSKGLLKVFVASRPEKWISNWLEAGPVLEVTPSKSDAEIKNYIQVEVDKRLYSAAISRDLKDRIKEILMARANGM